MMVNKLYTNTQGSSLIEYALIGFFISIIAVVVMTQVGDILLEMVTAVRDSFPVWVS